MPYSIYFSIDTTFDKLQQICDDLLSDLQNHVGVTTATPIQLNHYLIDEDEQNVSVDFICATANDFADRKFYINLTYVNQVETILFCNGEYVKTLNSIAFSKDNSIVEKKVLKNQLCIGLTMLYCIDANVSEQSFLDALTQNSTQKAKDILDFLLENKRLQ